MKFKVSTAIKICSLLFIVACSNSNSGNSPAAAGPGGTNNPQNPAGLGPAPVSLSPSGGEVQSGDLSAAGNYVIMAKAAISTTSGSQIVGNIALSPAAGSYFTGFSESLDASNEFSSSPMVTGKMYAADYAPPTPSNLTVAIGNMETAYTDAAGRSNPDATELFAGELGGQTLTPGLYTWSSAVLISTDMYLSGGPNDVFILQIAQDLTMEAAKSIHLLGGVQAKNVFWQVAGQVVIGTTSHFEGIILSKTAVSLLTGASINGRIYAQTAVTLDSSTVIQP